MRMTLAVIAAVLLSGCVSPKPQPDGPPPVSVSLWTMEHRGHLYVLRGNYNGHFIHSPACPCRHLEDPNDGQ
jgi:hypothetical protein